MRKNLVEKDFKSTLYEEVMPKIYGIGAAIVIVGAMFKILNWPGANLMIGVGLSTEAIIFFLSAFEPSAKSYDWTKVYPQLNEEYEGTEEYAESPAPGSNEYKKEMSNLAKTIKSLNASYSQELQSMNAQLKVSDNLYANSNKTFEEMQKASQQAEEFRIELEKLREKIAALNDIYDKTLNALKG